MENIVSFHKAVRNGVEFRLDPLTRHQTRINPARARRPKQGEGSDSGLDDLIKRSAEGCVFCPERIAEKVPRFGSELGEEDGRLKRGETLLFPNLNPFGENHAVAVISRAHFLPTDGFSAALLEPALEVCLEFFARMHKVHPEARWPTLVWNYMPPSAGSIVHPHLQLLLETEALPEVAAEARQAAEFARTHGREFWEALAEAEQATGERWIGALGPVRAWASFAPRALNEVTIAVAGARSWGQVGAETRRRLAEVLERLLRGYRQALGVQSFNLASFSGPLAGDEPGHALHLRLIARPQPRALYTSDTGPMERLYNSWVVDSLPELLAGQLRPFLADQPSPPAQQ